MSRDNSQASPGRGNRSEGGDLHQGPDGTESNSTQGGLYGSQQNNFPTMHSPFGASFGSAQGDLYSSQQGGFHTRQSPAQGPAFASWTQRPMPDQQTPSHQPSSVHPSSHQAPSHQAPSHQPFSLQTPSHQPSSHQTPSHQHSFASPAYARVRDHADRTLSLVPDTRPMEQMATPLETLVRHLGSQVRNIYVYWV